MRYYLLDKSLFRHNKEVFISKEKIIEMVKTIKKDKEISGFIYGIEAKKC